jgi:hypothetical protein
MKKLTKTVKKMLDALAYADAGENMTVRDKTQLLNKVPGEIAKAPVRASRARGAAGRNAQRVALYMGSELPPEVMDYVIQTCARLKHELTVLTFGPENAGRALLQPHEEALRAAAIDMKLVSLSGETVTGLNRYLRSHPEIAFLACKDSGYLGRSYLMGIQQKNALPVPVVVVTTQKGNEATQDHSAADQDTDSTIFA